MSILLTEYFALCEGGVCKDHLTESEKLEIKDKNALYLTGIIQRANVRNGNGRVYPRKVLEREVENYKKIISEKRAVGELDHSNSEVINLKNASHAIVNIWWQGDDVWGKLKVLSTPSGNILRNLVNDGIQLGISSRGLGSLTEDRNKNMVVNDDLILLCWDVVSDPSTSGAFLQLTESQIRQAINTVYTRSDKINRMLNEIVGKLGQ